MSKPEKFEWRLTWAGRPDSDMLRACFEHLQVFPLFRDSKARLVDFGEYQKLITDGLLEPALSYWQIKEGEVGLITLTDYAGYTNTWEKINTAKGDFEAGWLACEKRYKFLQDWDEAIAMEKARKAALKRRPRKTIVPVPAFFESRVSVHRICEEFGLLDCRWASNRHGQTVDKEGNYGLIITANDTGKNLEKLAADIYLYITR